MAKALERILYDRIHLSKRNRKQHQTVSTSTIVGNEGSKSRTFSNHESLLQQEPDFCVHGVDWSEYAESTSHCWWPYSSTKTSSHLCAYNLCNNDKSFCNSRLLQCATCSLIVHTIHLSQVQEPRKNADRAIPPCRPSFIDISAADDLNGHDQHYWSSTSDLSSSCIQCKKKLSKSFQKLTTDESIAIDSTTTCEQENINSKLNKPSNSLACLWCTRSYHHTCWENIKDDADQNKCDYGKFGDIIIRPQWLHRITHPSFAFRAQISNKRQENNGSFTPIIFFVNKVSGGQKGEKVYRTLVRLVNPRQVFLLENDTTIIEALKIYSSLPNIRVCICGGDGTVAWVFNHLVDAFPLLKNPPASIFPLGTGNDMSRALGWGHQYKSSQLRTTLMETSDAHPTILDRWRIQIEALNTDISNNNELINRRQRFLSFIHRPKFIHDVNHPLHDSHNTPVNTFFFNYISFGPDAAIVLDYQARRTRDPSKFTSPLKNKMLCMNESFKYFNDFAFGMAWDLSSYIRLLCDGQDLTESIRHCHSLVVLNTRSFGSGTHPWGRISMNQRENNSLDGISTNSSQTYGSTTDSHENSQTTSTNIDHFVTQDFGDGKIEVLGLNTRQMALLRIGFHGHRIAQCRQVRIELNHPMPVHMDGGPFYLAGSIAVNITHAGQLTVLRNETR